jgi:hypothetical protein
MRKNVIIAVSKFNFHIISDGGIEIKDGNVFVVEYINQQVILSSKSGKKMSMDRGFFDRNFMVM